MATSGSYDYSLTADDIITAAAEDIKVLEGGESLDSNDYATFLRTLNMLVKQWSGMGDFAPGLKAFSRKRVAMWLAKGQHQYTLGPASTDARCSTSWGRTTIDAAEASGQTVISVTDTSDTTTHPGSTLTMTANDIIGIEQDDGTIHWSTVSSISAGDTVTIGDATSAAASVGNYVWWFTSRAQRPEYIESAVLRSSDYTDTPLGLNVIGSDYDLGVTDKYGDGEPGMVTVEPQRINTRVILDSQPTDVTDIIVFTVLYPMEDYDNSSGTDDIAYPQAWYSALELELAARCAPKFSKPWTKDLEIRRSEAMTVARNQFPQNSSAYAMRDD